MTHDGVEADLNRSNEIAATQLGVHQNERAEERRFLLLRKHGKAACCHGITDRDGSPSGCKPLDHRSIRRNGGGAEPVEYGHITIPQHIPCSKDRPARSGHVRSRRRVALELSQPSVASRSVQIERQHGQRNRDLKSLRGAIRQLRSDLQEEVGSSIREPPATGDLDECRIFHPSALREVPDESLGLGCASEIAQ